MPATQWDDSTDRVNVLGGNDLGWTGLGVILYSFWQKYQVPGWKSSQRSAIRFDLPGRTPQGRAGFALLKTLLAGRTWRIE
jgi:hypothetical protein